MELTRTASTSRDAPPQPPATHGLDGGSRDYGPPSKRRRPDVVAPSSPSKPKPQMRQYIERGRIVDKDADARREASLLSFAEARAKASSNYSAADHSGADFQYPPGYNGDSSARGLLAQIKNRMEQRAPTQSNFLQKAKQVQQSLLEKQQRAAEVERRRKEAERRESARSTGFANEPDPELRNGLAEQSPAKCKSAPAQGAFSRAKEQAVESDTESEDEEADDYGVDAVGRDEDLALVEFLRPGPRPLVPDPDDPKWERMEPYSGHRLRERKLPHSQLKEHLRHRYHIPPSLLYSVARPLVAGVDGYLADIRRQGDYEVPVDGDWIVIATIVEKSELLVTKGFREDAPSSRDPSSSHKSQASTATDDDPVLFKDAGPDANGKLRLDLEPGNSNAFDDATAKKGKGWQRRNGGEDKIDDEFERARQQSNLANRARKFVILKLVDLGVNSKQGDGTGAAGRGDNYLSLIAYEADSIDTTLVHHNTNIRSEVANTISATANATKKWINGSRGAFELLYKQAEGTVVAIMNPKVLRPYAPRGKTSSMETKMLRLTPRSAEDCLIIGQAADYRRCSATKANGERCGSFVDIKARKQTGTSTCDYHLSRHMDELARGRPEFSANATSRFGGAGGSGGSGPNSAGVSTFDGRRRGGYTAEDSAINKITSSYAKSNSNPYLKASLAKKLNSSFGNVGDGMENNGGQIYASQSPLVSAPDADAKVRASDPSSWKYDVSGRYGRGNTEKQGRLKKQIEEEQLMRKIEARFAPPPARPSKSQRPDEAASDDAESAKKKKDSEAKVLPVLPNGSADMINAAYSTLDQRKRVAQQKQEATNAKRRKYTGVVDSPAAESESDSSKLKFMNLASTSAKQSSTLLGGLPIAGLTRHSADADASNKSSSDSRSKLLSLAQGATTSASTNSEPSLKLKKSHRPKLRLPSDEVGRVSKLKFLSGELVNLDDFEDDDWEDDLGDLKIPSAMTGEEAEGSESLSEKITQLRSQPQHEEEDSDLEII